ncbi:DUF4926 domain-containing protein [Okeania sp. SIO1I7]|uniref:DUF4926 domain-containing protein n=1 Tax=Okeania sp. SIO1I7 TaxID=2607772 RepID=UPI0013FBD72B|nr:DUF4926 domain-containing protein [Okeania sp. SIO1I7]NET25471.1 DUF4926 domain-containing protein [Okeania sp. SIO1I7]
MTFPLFYEIQLTQDIPELNLKKGSIGVIVEYYPISEEEDGYSVEGLIAQDTVEVAESQIQLINAEKIQEVTFLN